MRSQIEVAHFIPGLHFRDGGPSRSVVRLTDSLALDARLTVTLISHSVAGVPSIPSMNESVFRVTNYTNNSAAVRFGFVDRRLLLATLANQRVDLLHTHSVWHASNYWAAQLARRRSIPLICQPRGMLEPWAIASKLWKKRLAMLLFQRKDLYGASAFIATSDMEAANIRALGLRQPVALIPNGVDLPQLGPSQEVTAFAHKRERVVLFLSRMHPKKGVDLLIRAWAECRTPGWRLILVGPDEGGYSQEMLRHVRELGVSDSVEYLGALEGKAKEAVYRSADLFVLPSFSENFGLVVGEALSFGVPVITTRGTPWQELETYRCGWWIDIGVEPLVKAIRDAVSLSDEQRTEMGERGKILATRYQWSNAAGQTADFYHWILGRGDRPNCVVAD